MLRYSQFITIWYCRTQHSINALSLYRFTPQQRAGIGRYAYFHGVSAATHFYSVKLKIALSETTVQSIRDSYHCEINTRIKLGETAALSSLPERRRGRSKLIGDNIDQQVQLYIRNVQEGCGNISVRVVLGAAQGILEYYGKEELGKLINRHCMGIFTSQKDEFCMM